MSSKPSRWVDTKEFEQVPRERRQEDSGEPLYGTPEVGNRTSQASRSLGARLRRSLFLFGIAVAIFIGLVVVGTTLVVKDQVKIPASIVNSKYYSSWMKMWDSAFTAESHRRTARGQQPAANAGAVKQPDLDTSQQQPVENPGSDVAGDPSTSAPLTSDQIQHAIEIRLLELAFIRAQLMHDQRKNSDELWPAMHELWPAYKETAFDLHRALSAEKLEQMNFDDRGKAFAYSRLLLGSASAKMWEDGKLDDLLSDLQQQLAELIFSRSSEEIARELDTVRDYVKGIR